MDPEIFLKISLDNERAFKNIKEGENLFNDRKIKESLEFFQKVEKESKIFKSTYYTITGVATLGIGLPLAKIILSSSIDPVYKGLAHCYFWSGEYLKSLIYFNKINKKTFTDFYIEAWANYKTGNLEKSKILFDKSVEQKPELAKHPVPIY